MFMSGQKAAHVALNALRRWGGGVGGGRGSTAAQVGEGCGGGVGGWCGGGAGGGRGGEGQEDWGICCGAGGTRCWVKGSWGCMAVSPRWPTPLWMRRQQEQAGSRGPEASRELVSA